MFNTSNHFPQKTPQSQGLIRILGLLGILSLSPLEATSFANSSSTQPIQKLSGRIHGQNSTVPSGNQTSDHLSYSSSSSTYSSSSNNNNDCLSFIFPTCLPSFTAQVDPVTRQFGEVKVALDQCIWQCYSTSYACFSGGDTVQVVDSPGANPHSLAMSDLKVGDTLVVGRNRDGSWITDRVIDFFHREPKKEGAFLELYFQDSLTPLSITSYHLIKKAASECDSYDPQDEEGWVYAADLKVGDFIFLNNQPTAITHIQGGINKTGLYAPITENSCTVQVNGVACSSIAVISSHRYGKLYVKSLRPYLTTPLKREHCTSDYEHPMNPVESYFLNW